MGNGPSQPFRTKHLIWFRDRASFYAGHESGLFAALLSGAVFLAAIGILIVMSKIGALPQNLAKQ
jgi:hypothetical protein